MATVKVITPPPAPPPPVKFQVELSLPELKALCLLCGHTIHARFVEMRLAAKQGGYSHADAEFSPVVQLYSTLYGALKEVSK